jgi:hypothetical protein
MSPWARLTSGQLIEHIAQALADESASLVERAASLEKQLTEALANVKKYGSHISGCYSERNFDYDCDCGFYALAKEEA